ncbi:hypothetical protein LCGC14_0353510 [marine sediment metagenome]|uniref:Uncharacterized protein n=1 Tax=marine sediment metagenome TaxID=412755 RepID=A0A0F9TFQ6_9ZZZZ
MHWEIKGQIIRINLNGRFTIEWTEDVIDYGDILASLSERVDKAYEEARKLIPTI